MSKKRIEWMELAQIISMILVVFHHSMPNFTNFNSILDALGNTVHFPALSLFFFCSGYFATGWVKKGYGNYIKSRAVRLLIPWIVISLIMLFPKAVLAAGEARKSMLSLSGLGWVLLNPHGKGILPHLWYLPALFIICLFVPLIENAARNKIARVASVVMSFVLASLPNGITSILCLNEIRMYVVWFLIGYFINIAGLEFHRSFKLLLLAVISTAATLLMIFLGREFLFSRIIITVIGIISILSISILLEDALHSTILFFRGKTLCVYLWSLCAQNFVEVIAGKIGLNGNLTFLLMFITGMVVPLIIYEVCRKTPGWLKTAIGI